MKTKPPLPLLTRAESQVMAGLWEGGPQTVHQLLERLESGWAYTTLLTLVRILEQKGYVLHGPAAGGRAHLYRPATEPGRVRTRHLRDLMDRLFGGRAEGLVAGLITDESLGEDELKSLKQLIDHRLKNPGGAR